MGGDLQCRLRLNKIHILNLNLCWIYQPELYNPHAYIPMETPPKGYLNVGASLEEEEYQRLQEFLASLGFSNVSQFLKSVISGEVTLITNLTGRSL